jgi:MYXO-CTERM domain-containing protein
MKAPSPPPFAVCFALASLLLLSPAWARIETRLLGGARADFLSNGASPDVTDNRLFELGLPGQLPGAQKGLSVARADGDIFIETSPAVFTRRTDVGSLAAAAAIADHAVVRAEAFADSGGGVITFHWDDAGNSSERLWFNKAAQAQATADTFSSRLILGAPGSSGLITFTGFIEGSLRDNQRLFSEVGNPTNRRTSMAQADFLFAAGVTNTPGNSCFVSGASCAGNSQRFSFNDGEQGSSLYTYSRNFSVTIDATAGQELQTWMSLAVSASFIARADFGSSGHITAIQVSDGLALDNSDGLLVQNGNSYTLLNSLPVPEPGTWALWLAGLALGMVHQRRRAVQA